MNRKVNIYMIVDKMIKSKKRKKKIILKINSSQV